MRARLLLLLAVTLLTAAACDEPQGCSGAACLLEAFPALGPTVVEGGPLGVELLAGVTGLEPQDVPLAEIGPLSAEQEALLGCGPYWGTDCRVHGVDLRNAEVSGLLQGWPGAPAIEMGLVSFNLVQLLIALSSLENAGPGYLDPSDPYSQFPGQCSFLQPLSCAFIRAMFDVVPPDRACPTVDEAPAVLPGGREARGTRVVGFVPLPGDVRWSPESCRWIRALPTVLPPARGISDTSVSALPPGGAAPRCSITSPHLCASFQQLVLQVRSGRRSALRDCTDDEPALDMARRGRC